MADDKTRLIEFLLKMEVDSEFAGRYAGDPDERGSLVDNWGFQDPKLIKALKDKDGKTVESYMNPGSILMKGWVRSPSS
jgi:hypothetical protein